MYNILELGEVINVPLEGYGDFFSLPIYKIFKKEYLLRIFETNKLYFSNIFQAWEDPYELFLLKHDFRVDGLSANKYYLNAAKQMYGQSWSLEKDSDALWRIYSQDKMSVRIKTTFGKMMKIIDQVRGIMWCAPGFGKVRYMDTQEINKWVNNIQKQGTGIYDMSFMESLFIKRSEFSHEKEVRFILWNSNEDTHTKLIHLNINPFDLIEEIAFDPRLNEESYARQYKTLQETISGKMPIVKSDLYSFDRLSINLKRTPIILQSAYDKYNKHLRMFDNV